MTGDPLTPALKALACTPRLDILRLLRDKGPQRVTDIAEHIGLSQGTTSHHLKVLRGVGLVWSDTRNLEHIQTLLPQRVGQIADQIGALR